MIIIVQAVHAPIIIAVLVLLLPVLLPVIHQEAVRALVAVATPVVAVAALHVQAVVEVVPEEDNLGEFIKNE